MPRPGPARHRDDQTFGIEEIRETHPVMEASETRGKMVVVQA
jgi:hypothetical protein